MRKSRWRGARLGVAATLAALMVVATPATHATADEPDPGIETMGMVVDSETQAEFAFTDEQVDQAETVAAESAADADLTEAEQAAADELVEFSEQNGTGTADPEAVEVVSLAGGDILVAKTPTTDLEDVQVTIIDGEVQVVAETNSAATAINSGGPGMAGTWGAIVGGDYTLTVKNLGNGNFTWQRRRFNDPASQFYYYWYRRTGDGFPKDITGPNAKVKVLRIQNFPYDNTAEEAEASWPDSNPRLAVWQDRAPAVDFEGKCNSSPINPSITVPGGSVGISFVACDQYHVWRNAAKPSSYWLELDQGWMVTNGGAKSAAYVISWQARKKHPNTGATLLSGSQHDLNKLVFTIPGSEGDSKECTQTDASRTC